MKGNINCTIRYSFGSDFSCICVNFVLCKDFFSQEGKVLIVNFFFVFFWLHPVLQSGV